MTVHVTAEGFLAVVGAVVIIAAVLYIICGVVALWRWGK